MPAGFITFLPQRDDGRTLRSEEASGIKSISKLTFSCVCVFPLFLHWKFYPNKKRLLIKKQFMTNYRLNCDRPIGKSNIENTPVLLQSKVLIHSSLSLL